MADVPKIGPVRGPTAGNVRASDARGPGDRTLAHALVRALAILGGITLGLGALGFSLVTGRGVPLPLMGLLYFCTIMLVWGVQGLFLRKLSLGPFSLLVFAAAVFGVLFLLGYFTLAVVGPFASGTLAQALAFVHLTDLIFYAMAVMSIAGAAGCAFSTNIIYSAWSLLFAFMGVAGLYVFLGADFPAMAQVLIYVGGILVLILFAIMLTKQIGEDPKLTNAHISLPVGAALGAAAIAALSYMAVMAPWKMGPEAKMESSARGLGIAFLTEYLLPFELASVVLLAALVGSVVIARKEIKETSDTPV